MTCLFMNDLCDCWTGRRLSRLYTLRRKACRAFFNGAEIHMMWPKLKARNALLPSGGGKDPVCGCATITKSRIRMEDASGYTGMGWWATVGAACLTGICTVFLPDAGAHTCAIR